MVAQNVAFGLLAAAAVVAALKVVTTQNVVHAALYLVVVLSSIAAIFVLLAAEFVAITQILVYVGAIVVLFLFGIMLTRAQLGRTHDLDNNQRPAAAERTGNAASSRARSIRSPPGHPLPGRSVCQ